MTRLPSLRVSVLGCVLGCVAAVSWVGGCAEKPPESDPVAAVENPAPQEQTPAPAPKPDPAEVWGRLVTEGTDLLANDRLDEVEAHLSKFDSVYESPEKPGDEQRAAVDDLKRKLASRRGELLDQKRADGLAKARGLVDEGKYEDAQKSINEVQALAPSSAQREEIASLLSDIESRRAARRRLDTWMKLLAAPDKKDVRTAQTQLFKEADVALPLLLESVQSVDNPHLVANTLELLRRLQRPQTTLPAMFGVLKREKQQTNWPDAVREIGRVASPGLGPQLLELALTSENPAQRSAAFEALALVPDPPEETLIRLLPRLFEDSPDLPHALRACAQAVRLHRQFDVVARRGLDAELSDEEEQRLDELPARLQKLIDAAAGATPPSDTAQAAQVLAVVTRQIAPAPLENVKVLSFGAQSEDGKAAAVLDGVWNKLDYPTQWRHPIDKRSTLILDLGEERTVEGVRIWNFNETNGTHRGWKEVEIYVTNTPTALTPIATGIVPPAPGAADTPDYSTIVPVPSARGRYVTLQARSVWRPDTYMGLSEVQVLGY